MRLFYLVISSYCWTCYPLKISLLVVITLLTVFLKTTLSYQLQHVMGLEVELDHSKSTVQNGCPLFEPSPGTECIHHHAEMCKKNIDTFSKLLK